MEWCREDHAISHSQCALHSQQVPVELLCCGGSTRPLLAHANGEVESVGGNTCALAPRTSKEWAFAMADVCGNTVCVIGTGRDVTIGIAESADGQLGKPFINSIPSKGSQFVCSCLCEDKVLLLCECMSL